LLPLQETTYLLVSRQPVLLEFILLDWFPREKKNI
jgi:hypothetical protein